MWSSFKCYDECFILRGFWIFLRVIMLVNKLSHFIATSVSGTIDAAAKLN